MLVSRGEGGGEFCFDPGQRGHLGCLWCHLGCGGGVYSGRPLYSKRRAQNIKDTDHPWHGNGALRGTSGEKEPRNKSPRRRGMTSGEPLKSYKTGAAPGLDPAHCRGMPELPSHLAESTKPAAELVEPKQWDQVH